MTELNYYCVGFSYKHARRGISAPGVHIALSVNEEEETNNLCIACKAVREALKENLIRHEHAYSYPDGSLYYYIETEMNEYDLKAKLTHILPEHAPFSIYEEDRTSEKFHELLAKFGRSTAESLVQAMIEDGVDRTMSLDDIDSLLSYVKNNPNSFVNKAIAVLEKQRKDYLT